MFGDDHVLAQKFVQIQIRLPDGRAAPVLQHGLALLDEAAEQRRQQEQQRGLRKDQCQVQAHKAKISNNKSVMNM